MSRSNSHPSRSAHQFGGRFTGQNRVTMLFLAATHGRAASDLIDRLRSRVEGPAPASDPMRHGRSISVPFESMNRYHSHVDNVMTGCRDVVARRLTSVKDQSARPAAGPQLGPQLVDCLFTPGSTGLTDSNFKRNQKRKTKPTNGTNVKASGRRMLLLHGLIRLLLNALMAHFALALLICIRRWMVGQRDAPSVPNR